MLPLPALLLCSMGELFSGPAPEIDLYPEDLRWKYRLLVLGADSLDAPEILSQKEAVLRRDAGFRERDMWLILLSSNGEGSLNGKALSERSAKRLFQRWFGVGDDLPEALLIGKDGGIKMREPAPVDLDAVFTRIDGMPMRRREMQEDR